jgi:hypothetical protein
MPVFLMISRHSPEKCPMNNDQAKKMAFEVGEKLRVSKETQSQDRWKPDGDA